MHSQTALVLAGHGSHISPSTAGLVWRYVDRLRAQGIANEVTACFWKEQPSLHEGLDSLAADDITIIPVFTAQGYFTRQVVPAEMGLDGPVTQRGNRIIRYGKTLGEYHALAGVVYQRVTDTLSRYQLDAQQTTVAIVGHGTKRSYESQQTTRDQVQQLMQRGLVADLLDAYLDDDPDIPSIYQRAKTADVVVVPFFLAPGSHVTIDVPSALGLPAGESFARLNGKHIYYTDPVGTNEEVCQFITALAYEAGLPRRQPDTAIWGGFPQAGGTALIEQVQETGGMLFGELRLTPDMVQPVHLATAPITLDNPASLRTHIRETPFRALASQHGLPQNWQVPVPDIADLPAIVETIYPGGVAAWAQQQHHQFQANRLSQTIARQQGNFRDLAALSTAQVDNLVESVCSQCVKSPVWHHQNLASHSLPCGDPCNVWLSDALASLEPMEHIV